MHKQTHLHTTWKYRKNKFEIKIFWKFKKEKKSKINHHKNDWIRLQFLEISSQINILYRLILQIFPSNHNPPIPQNKSVSHTSTCTVTQTHNLHPTATTKRIFLFNSFTCSFPKSFKSKKIRTFLAWMSAPLFTNSLNNFK